MIYRICLSRDQQRSTLPAPPLSHSAAALTTQCRSVPGGALRADNWTILAKTVASGTEPEKVP